MKLWKLFPRPDCVNEDSTIDWETYQGRVVRLVVRAPTEEDARRLASHNSGAEDETRVWENGDWHHKQRDSSVWLDPDCTVCEELTLDGLPGIVLRGVRAG